MVKFFKTIINFLFSTVNREFLIFLFFFALAGIFWLLMTLNETYEQEVRIPLYYKNVPKNAVITSGETDTFKVTVSDKGIILAAYLLGNAIQPMAVDFKTYAVSNEHGLIPLSDLKKMALASLNASSKIINVKPEHLTFYFNYGEKKRVPVHYSGNVIPDNLYYMANVKYKPDSVTIYASAQKLDSINLVYTERLNFTAVRDTLTVTVPLRKITGVKTVPEEVTVSFHTDVLSEVCMPDVPIKGINMPAGKVLRTFPAKVNINFVAGISRFRTMKKNDFEVVADYNEIMSNPSSKCRIYLNKMPEGISSPRLDTTMVEYLIEE